MASLEEVAPDLAGGGAVSWITGVAIFLLVIVVMIDHSEIHKLNWKVNKLAEAMANMAEVIKK